MIIQKHFDGNLQHDINILEMEISALVKEFCENHASLDFVSATMKYQDTRCGQLYDGIRLTFINKI